MPLHSRRPNTMKFAMLRLYPGGVARKAFAGVITLQKHYHFHPSITVTLN